jgi:digeranylgeranylglycerophospholipid reductase
MIVPKVYTMDGVIFFYLTLHDRLIIVGQNGIDAVDIAIIGAGPIGSYTAWRLSKLGYSVKIFEDHSEAGRPEQCAGLVNKHMFELPGLNDVLPTVHLHDIIGADIYSPSGNVLGLRANRVKAISMDRALFDKTILRNAVNAGAEVELTRRVMKVENKDKNGFLLKTKGIGGNKDLTSNWLLGCDGSSSTIVRDLEFNRPMNTIPGVAMQVEVQNGEVPKDIVGVFTGEDTAKGFFAWSVPAGSSSSMRIGLAAEDGISLNRGYRALTSDTRLKSWLGSDDSKISNISMNFGPVPMGSPKTLTKGNAIILGDSAGMAKPTSGGGIYPGLMAVNDLANSIDNVGEFNQQAIEGFKASWLSGYGKELERSRFFRNIISQVKDEEIEEVIMRLSDPELLKVINEEGDIDHPLRLALTLIRKDTSLLKLIPRFLPHMRKMI